MTDLDMLARAATQELLERSVPDTGSRYAELRHMRARRRTTRLAAIAASGALAVGGWQLLGSRGDEPIEPAPRPGAIRNGVLLGLSAHIDNPAAGWQALDGEEPAYLPRDPAGGARYQFTSAGTEVVYADHRAHISAVALATGAKRRLADCPDHSCAAALSPDGLTIASTDGEQVRLQPLGSGAVTTIPAPGSGLVGAPAWSPDGAELAFAGVAGLYVVTIETGEVRRVVSNPQPGTVQGPVSWSPTSRTVAYFVGRPKSLKGYEETAFTATAVDLTTETVTPLLDAGQCFCAGVPAPALTWSPDGTVIAVATTTGTERTWGVYLVRPDGSGVEQVRVGPYAALAWQPLTG